MIVIESNGSKWAGQSPDPLQALFERLANHPLDPSFEDCGNFVGPARTARHVRGYNEDGEFVDYYEDTGPLYPMAPSAVSFFGNFYTVSAVFNIDTDEPELIERLTAAIRANQGRADYQAAKGNERLRSMIGLSVSGKGVECDLYHLIRNRLALILYLPIKIEDQEMSNREYLSCAETAKLMRQALKESFPGIKFAVRSSTYSGGASIRVYWTDGPSAKQVEGVTGAFEGAYFDGMIDYKGSNYHTLDGKPVKFGANFIFSEHKQSKAAAEAKVAFFADKYGRSDWVLLAGGEFGGYYTQTSRDAPSLHLALEAYDALTDAALGFEAKESPTLGRIKFAGDDGYGAGTVGPDGTGRRTAEGYPRS